MHELHLLTNQLMNLALDGANPVSQVICAAFSCNLLYQLSCEAQLVQKLTRAQSAPIISWSLTAHLVRSFDLWTSDSSLRWRAAPRDKDVIALANRTCFGSLWFAE